MKKTLAILGTMALGMGLASYAAEPAQPPFEVNQAQKVEFKKPEKQAMLQNQLQKKEEFEKRLKLTDEQKAKSKELREASQVEMKPVMDAIKAKHDEIVKLRQNKSTTIGELEKKQAELKELHKKAHTLRMNNMKQFEEILTDKQKKELEKMKKEGRKNFENMQKKKGMLNPPPMHNHPDFNKK